MNAHLIPRVGRLALAALVVTLGLVVPLAPAASADEPPVVDTVGADALPTWQINGVVWSQAIVGTTVYVTGSFTKARPPGVPVGGAGEIDAANIFAYDVTTGNPVGSFSHALNAQGLVIRASGDGSRVYVGGDFTTVDGAARGHVAAFSTATGALLGWAPNIGGQVRALAVAADTVYVGGNYPSANGETRTHLAAFRVSNAQMTDWAPVAAGTGGYVWTMVMSPDQTQVIAGGSFATLNGVGRLRHGRARRGHRRHPPVGSADEDPHRRPQRRHHEPEGRRDERLRLGVRVRRRAPASRAPSPPTRTAGRSAGSTTASATPTTSSPSRARCTPSPTPTTARSSTATATPARGRAGRRRRPPPPRPPG